MFSSGELEYSLAPKIHGGLGIRDLALFNLALGANLLWRLITGKSEWWKQFILFKYLSCPRIWCLDGEPPVQRGSQIRWLLKASIPLLQSRLTWIPSNDKLINLWSDSIIGNPPLL
jgi:hypothetical protein